MQEFIEDLIKFILLTLIIGFGVLFGNIMTEDYMHNNIERPYCFEDGSCKLMTPADYQSEWLNLK